MWSKVVSWSGIVALAVVSSLPAAADSNEVGAVLAAVALQHRAVKQNPFERPDSVKRKKPVLITEQQVAPQTLLHLRAVLYSPDSPMVNINGKILTLGEEIDGFLLEEVSEDGAILARDDVQIMLSMTQAPDSGQ